MEAYIVQSCCGAFIKAKVMANSLLMLFSGEETNPLPQLYHLFGWPHLALWTTPSCVLAYSQGLFLVVFWGDHMVLNLEPRSPAYKACFACA